MIATRLLTGYTVVHFEKPTVNGAKYNGIVVFDENGAYVKDFNTFRWLDVLRCSRWLRKQSHKEQ